MSTNSAPSRKGSHGLRFLLQWIRTLSLHRTARDVMFVFAEHSNYWDGSNSYPGIPTVARKANITERHAHRIIRELRMAGHLIQTIPARGTLPATYDLAVKAALSADSTVSTGEKSTFSAGVTSGAPGGDISGSGGVTFGASRGDISTRAIRKTVSTTVNTTVLKAPQTAAEEKSNLNAWEKLVPGLQQRVLKQKEFIHKARVGNYREYNSPEAKARAAKGDWLMACVRADIWPHVAEQIAQHFHDEVLREHGIVPGLSDDEILPSPRRLDRKQPQPVKERAKARTEEA